MRRPSLFERLDGPPIALPRHLDRISERWWSLPPRWRFVVLGAACAMLVAGGLAHVAATPYGPPMSVLVAVHDLPVGHHLGPGDVRRTDWPRDLVPDGALEAPNGQLVAMLPGGTVLTTRHIATDGIASALPAGSAAVAIPLDSLPALAVGTHLDLVGRDLDGRAQVLTRGATVVTVDDADAWLAVAEPDAAQVAAAAASGVITVVVVGR